MRKESPNIRHCKATWFIIPVSSAASRGRLEESSGRAGRRAADYCAHEGAGGSSTDSSSTDSSSTSCSRRMLSCVVSRRQAHAHQLTELLFLRPGPALPAPTSHLQGNSQSVQPFNRNTGTEVLHLLTLFTPGQALR